MSTPASRLNADTITIRLERQLKDEFISTVKSENLPASEVLRDLMLDYIARKRRERFEEEARRQSALASSSPDEEEVMRWIESVTNPEGQS
jgi:antitoxin component of RelBE/YafQ-DinJ toxin-antitoxin module